jgi:hypothetical protein
MVTTVNSMNVQFGRTFFKWYQMLVSTYLGQDSKLSATKQDRSQNECILKGANSLYTQQMIGNWGIEG